MAMRYCVQCGEPLLGGVRFCTACGAPVVAAPPAARPAAGGTPATPRPRRRLGLWVALPLVILLAAAGGSGAVLWLRHHDGSTTTAAAPGTRSAQTTASADPAEGTTGTAGTDVPTDRAQPGAPSATTGSADSASTSPVPATTSPPAGATPSGPMATLRGMVRQDRPSADGLVVVWTTQLASNRPGLDPTGHRWTGRSVLAKHREWLAQYPGAILVDTTQWPHSYQFTGYFATLSGEQFDSAAGAIAWCRGEGLGRDDCLAERLSYTGDFHDNSQLQPED